MTLHAVIIGLGYVGLPLAQSAVLAGIRVTGIDADRSVVDSLNASRSHVDDLSDADIAEMIGKGFCATTDPKVIKTADVIVICVPTPLSDDGGPDLRAVLSATRMVRDGLHEGLTVILESTTYPGTTEEVVLPNLENMGLQVGTDFHLAFSPERIDPGNRLFGIKNTPKVVGGVTQTCTEAARAFYNRFIDTTVPTRGTREAEMSKLLENTYRHINIALVNEMARFCHDLDIDLWNVIEAAKTKPFGFQAFYPGPGVGGHCIPIDPNYLSHTVKAHLGYPFRFVELAQEINSSMPSYVVRRLQDLLNEAGKPLKGATVLVVGVTYKPDVADQRQSPATPIAQILIRKGAVVQYYDPHVDEWEAVCSSVRRVDDVFAAATAADVTVLLQNHRSLELSELASAAQLVLDTRGVIQSAHSHVSRL